MNGAIDINRYGHGFGTHTLEGVLQEVRPLWLQTLHNSFDELCAEPDVQRLISEVALSVSRSTQCEDVSSLEAAIRLKFWQELRRIAEKYDTAQHRGGWRRYLLKLARQAAYGRAVEERSIIEALSRKQ